jgi:hypothetical protein
VIDLSEDSPATSESEESSKQAVDSSIVQKYTRNYIVFDRRLRKIEAEKINRAAFIREPELKLECIKHLLNDWIFITSKDAKCGKVSRLDTNSQIDADDLQVFSEYLLYLLHERKDLGQLALIMRVFKRLILKNGSLEWTETYKEVRASLQAGFYEKYDSTIDFD